jgi:hypothetical protein
MLYTRNASSSCQWNTVFPVYTTLAHCGILHNAIVCPLLSGFEIAVVGLSESLWSTEVENAGKRPRFNWA